MFAYGRWQSTWYTSQDSAQDNKLLHLHLISWIDLQNSTLDVTDPHGQLIYRNTPPTLQSWMFKTRSSIWFKTGSWRGIEFVFLSSTRSNLIPPLLAFFSCPPADTDTNQEKYKFLSEHHHLGSSFFHFRHLRLNVSGFCARPFDSLLGFLISSFIPGQRFLVLEPQELKLMPHNWERERLMLLQFMWR